MLAASMWKVIGTTLAISAAYLFASLYFVWPALRLALARNPDLSHDFSSRPRISHVVFLAVGWLPLTIALCFLPDNSLNMLKREATSWLLFAVFLIIGLYFW
jgi:hypothetical protein